MVENSFSYFLLAFRGEAFVFMAPSSIPLRRFASKAMKIFDEFNASMRKYSRQF